jgi:hypothetical protein
MFHTQYILDFSLACHNGTLGTLPNTEVFQSKDVVSVLKFILLIVSALNQHTFLSKLSQSFQFRNEGYWVHFQTKKGPHNGLHNQKEMRHIESLLSMSSFTKN